MSEETRQNETVEVRDGAPAEAVPATQQKEEICPAAAEQSEEPKAESEPSFEQLISGRYKKDYEKKIKEVIRERFRDREAREKGAEWVRSLKSQEAEVQKLLPGFELDREMQNPLFASLVRPGGLSLEDAVYAVHHREIVKGAVANAASTAAQQVANSVASNLARPREGGISDSPKATIKSDPSKFTSQDLKDIRERVRRGEKIYF